MSTCRLKFSKELWPEEHIHLLGPRAVLQVEGSAFPMIARLAPEKLRQPDGIKILVETLGGSWGKTQTEERYHFIVQTIYQVAQESETNDSYLARHDAFFEELLARKVTTQEARAYILLRHSLLTPEEKKVVVEALGDLKYEDTVTAITLLGSKFFGDLQQRNAGSTGSSKSLARSRVYDIHHTKGDVEEEAYASFEEEPSDDAILCFFLESHNDCGHSKKRTRSNVRHLSRSAPEAARQGCRINFGAFSFLDFFVLACFDRNSQARARFWIKNV